MLSAVRALLRPFAAKWGGRVGQCCNPGVISTCRAGFPDQDQFVGYYDSGALSSPEDAAAKVCACMPLCLHANDHITASGVGGVCLGVCVWRGARGGAKPGVVGLS